jgi:broad specificity phosphatase PhoE
MSVSASASSLPRIYLVRHGETEWSHLGKHTGKTDLPLLPHGEADALKVGPRLAKLSFAQVWSSPRLRARRTCELAGLGAAMKIEEDLQEWDYGAYEGMTADEIRATHPGWHIYRDGCPEGESAAAITARADRLVEKLASCHGSIAVFSHGHFLRILTARWLHWPIENAQNLLLSTASLSILEFNHGLRSRPVISLWNDIGDRTG